MVVNYAENRGQCYLRLPFPELQERQLLLMDLMGREVYHRDGGDLVQRGLYIDQAPWQINVFEVRSTTRLHDKASGDQARFVIDESRPPPPCRMAC